MAARATKMPSRADDGVRECGNYEYEAQRNNTHKKKTLKGKNFSDDIKLNNRYHNHWLQKVQSTAIIIGWLKKKFLLAFSVP